MVNNMPDLNQRNKAKKSILLYGGTHEMDKDKREYFDEWLIFLANPLNLQPGLPDLTLTVDSGQLDDSFIRMSFDRNKASIRSMKFELIHWHEGSTNLFLNDSEKKISGIDGKPKDPCHIKKWIFNLFLHSGLEELELPAIKELQPILNKLPNTKINWTPFTPSSNTRY